jgi:predicted DNA-binding transcriptional regulator AlpA
LQLNAEHIMEQPQYSDNSLIRDTRAATLLGCSKATFWRRVADGTIPKPVKIGGTSRWPLGEIIEVIEAAKGQRGQSMRRVGVE